MIKKEHLKKFKSVVSFSKVFSYVFVAIGIVSIPFPFFLFPYQEKLTTFIFGSIIATVKPYIFKHPKYDLLSSDSSSLYTLLFILIGLAFISTLFLLKRKGKKYVPKITEIVNIMIPYYVGLMLLKYGIDKLFLEQFYNPEPNILFTPLAYLDRDILFWSIMGFSPIFNFFLGFTQTFTAILLLFKRTRFFGFIGAVFIFTNIVLININFDISVKIMSLFLLFTSIVGLFKYVFVFKEVIASIALFYRDKIYFFGKNNFMYSFLKSFIILLVLFEVFYPVIQKSFIQSSKNKQWSHLIGGYSIIENKKNGEPSVIPEFKRFFIHKNSYFISQDINDQMIDYKLEIIEENHQFILTDYNLKKTTINYSIKDNTLLLQFYKQKVKYQLTSKKIVLDSLPILKRQFHWSIDAIK